MPTLTQLEYAIAVDRFRHFGRAARACYVTQPTLSAQLQKLEAELGFELFDRTRQPVVPTKAGQAALEHARAAVLEMKKLEALGQTAEAELSGDFALAVIPTLAAYLLPLFLEPFARAYPKVRLSIREMTTAQIVEALGREEIDAGLLATPVPGAGLTEEPLFYEPFYAYVPTSHHLAKRTRLGQSDLDGCEAWVLEEGHCLRNQVASICSPRTRKAALASVRFDGGSLETLKRLVERGLGFTLLPHLALERGSLDGHPAKGARVIPFAKPIPSREVGLVFRRGQLKAKILEALGKTVVASLPEELRKLRKKDLDVVPID
jgi:LysR family hydrogen peroxide-inducible transcriptional activator